MAFCTNCGKRLSDDAAECEACGARIAAGKSTSPGSTGSAKQSGPQSNPDEIETRGVDLSVGGEFETAPPDTSSASSLGAQSGRVLGGRYQLNQCIGAGGMGEIYRARRLHIGDTVAVKVLRPDVVEGEKSRQRFYREARAAAMLHHPNAVVIHDFGEDLDGTTYIVMELLVGRSLRQLLIDEGSISASRAYGIIRQACAALDAGHRNGIIHRDIKPDNIILLDSNDGTDHVKILDFGIAKLLDKAVDTASLEQRLTNVGTVIGTPHYMSPEQCQGEDADARSDIYSLGIVLYELLTGVAPFIAKTPTGIAIKHVTERPRSLRELNPNITLAVEHVVLHALEKSPNARPQTALELAREFEAMLLDQSETTRFPALVEPLNADRADTDRAKAGASGEADMSVGFSETGSRRSNEAQLQIRDTVALPSSSTDQIASSPTDQASPPDTGGQRITVAELKAREAFRPGEVRQQQLERAEGAEEVEGPEGADGEPGTGGLKEMIRDPLRTTVWIPEADRIGPIESKGEAEPESKGISPIPSPSQQSKPPVPAVPAMPVRATSRAPLFIGLLILLLVVVGLLIWRIVSYRPETGRESTAGVTVSPSPGSFVQPSPSPPSTPEVAAPEGMAYVVGGVLKIGRNTGGDENERPARAVTINPFFLDLTEVTNEQYQEFIYATGYAPPPSWQASRFPEGYERFPVTDVTWEDATAYAAWAGKRLPTEEEWEFAARGPEGRIYPWGNRWIANVANVSPDAGEKRSIAPVGQSPGGASPFGILDLSGNAWEWTASDYKAYPNGKISLPAGYQNLKVIRGGSYASTPAQATATRRRPWPATRKDWPADANISPDYSQTGFRCAQDVNN